MIDDDATDPNFGGGANFFTPILPFVPTEFDRRSDIREGFIGRIAWGVDGPVAKDRQRASRIYVGLEQNLYIPSLHAYTRTLSEGGDKRFERLDRGERKNKKGRERYRASRPFVR